MFSNMHLLDQVADRLLQILASKSHKTEAEEVQLAFPKTPQTDLQDSGES